jgi:hypothetical protein
MLMMPCRYWKRSAVDDCDFAGPGRGENDAMLVGSLELHDVNVASNKAEENETNFVE